MSLYLILTNEPSYSTCIPDPSGQDTVAVKLMQVASSTSCLTSSLINSRPLCITKPAHLYLVYKSDIHDTSGNWILDNLVLESNARNCEFYTTLSRDGREGYLSTSRGSPIAESGEDVYSTTISMVDSNTENVIHCLHLKLLSLRPSNEGICSIRMIQVRWRMIDNTPTMSDERTNECNNHNMGDVGNELPSTCLVSEKYMVQKLESFMDNQMKFNAAVNQAVTNMTQQIKTMHLTMMIHQQEQLKKYSLLEKKMDQIIHSLAVKESQNSQSNESEKLNS